MKFMATKPLEGDNPPVVVFQHSQSNFYFSEEKGNPCFVKPYFIIFDGQEILAHTNNDGEVELGFHCLVERPNSFFVGRRTAILFNQLIEQTILANLYKLFPTIRMRVTESGKEIGPDRPIGEDIDLPREKLIVHSANRAGYSLDHKSLYSFYFICFPQNKSIKLIPASDTPSCSNILLRDFIRTGLVSFKLNFLSKAIAVMLGTGDIVLPTLE